MRQRFVVPLVGSVALAALLGACSGSGQAATSSTSAAVSSSPSSTATAPPSAAGGSGGKLYLALGDSLAAGYQPGGTEHRDVAYPALAAARLTKDGTPVDLVNLGCSGENTASMIGGGKCSFPAGSQLKEAEKTLAARAGDVALVTVDVGGNDILHCAQGLVVDEACVATGLAQLRRELPTILGRLRAAAGADTPIYVLGYYNPAVAAPLVGVDKTQAAAASAAFEKLTGDIEVAAKAAGTSYVSLDEAFRAKDTTPTTIGGRTVPANVAQVCTLTFVCTAADIHFTDEGAATVANVIAQVARSGS